MCPFVTNVHEHTFLVNFTCIHVGQSGTVHIYAPIICVSPVHRIKNTKRLLLPQIVHTADRQSDKQASLMPLTGKKKNRAKTSLG